MESENQHDDYGETRGFQRKPVAREQEQGRYDQDNDGDPVCIRRNRVRGHVEVHRSLEGQRFRGAQSPTFQQTPGPHGWPSW